MKDREMTPGDGFEKEASRAPPPPRRTSGVGGERENDGRAEDRGDDRSGEEWGG